MGKQFERIIVPGTFVVFLGFVITCVNLYAQGSGHPINLITGGLDILGVVIAWILVKCGRSYFCSWLVVPFFLYHSLAIVFVYNEWLTDSFNKYPKVNTDYMIILSFLTVNAVPLINFKQTLFFMYPILLATTSVQFKVTSKLLSKVYEEQD